VKQRAAGIPAARCFHFPPAAFAENPNCLYDNPMPFNRPPRIQPTLSKEAVKVPPPPQLPQEPGAFSWMTIVIPLGGILLMVVLMGAVGGGAGGGMMYLLTLPMMLGGYILTYYAFQNSKKDFKKKLSEGRQEYSKQLQKTENHLYSLREREQAVLRRMNPDLEECQRLAEHQDPRLGERRPADPDFLMPRLGIGILPTSITIQPADVEKGSLELIKEMEQAKTLAEKFAIVPDVPIVARLMYTGPVGIAGARADAVRVARSILCHLLIHHWFAEVQVAALGEKQTLADWLWLAAVPHASAAFAWPKADLRFSDPDSCQVLLELEKELKRREQILDARKMVNDPSTVPPLPCLVVVLDSFPQTFSHPGLDLLLKKGKSLGVYALYLTPEASQTPGECGAILDVRPGNLTYKESGTGGVAIDCRPDFCDPARADAIAHALSRVDWAQKEDLSQPPAMITFLKMLEAAKVEDLPIEKWWNDGSPFGFLQAPIGKTSATSEFIFDLRDQDGSHGPHGLLGGMTGSGKSEVLKTLILAMAVTSHPHDLNFALVDYKGGAAFNELAKLPHTVGVMTDIESHASYAERVLLALGGELERRKLILERARSIFKFGRSHVDDYRTMKIKQPLPHLVIVFDEFAEFKARNPEESKRLISIARLGRSLGVHLILATQNISAAIDPQILQNSNFRVCLRTSQPEDSVQMIGIPDAIHLVRGRAYFYSTGRSLVQIAYCGGKYQSSGAEKRPDQLTVVHPGGRKETVTMPFARVGDPAGKPGDVQITEANAIVDRLNAAMKNLNLLKPPPVWTDPLPERLLSPDLFRDYFTGGWDGSAWHSCRRWEAAEEGGGITNPVLGICDIPQRQEQPLFELPLEEGGGHFLVFGSASAGKTTLLKTLAVSIARMYSPAQAQIYILDFGGQSHLRVLENFPHVGSVITRFETERAERLLRFAQTELKRRNDLFRRKNVGAAADYNRLPDVTPLPDLFFFIDNFLGLKRVFPPEFISEIASLVGGSASSGIHLAAATYLPGDLPGDLQSNVHTQATLHQSTQTEYFGIVGMIGESRLQEDVGRPPRAGRGFLRGTPPVEFQAALPVGGSNDQEQMEQILELGAKMTAAWKGPKPASIESLSYSVPLPKSVRAPKPARPHAAPQGKDFDTLQPLGMGLEEDGPIFLVTSSAGQSGKTTAMLSWAVALAEKYSPKDLQFLFIDFHSRNLLPLKNLPHTLEYVNNQSEVEPFCNRLRAVMEKRAAALEDAFQKNPERFDREAFLAGYPAYVLMIDDYDRLALRCESAGRQLAECLAAGGDAGLSMIVAGNGTDLPKDYDDDLMKKARRMGCGLLFSGNAQIDQFNNAKSPPYQPMAGLPAGRGYFIRKGRARIFQNFMYWEEGKKSADCLLERIEKIRAEGGETKKPAWPD
jgi:S-DNA-T family DNA segregation ATPase FtsK/SpoIIIE